MQERLNREVEERTEPGPIRELEKALVPVLVRMSETGLRVDESRYQREVEDLRYQYAKLKGALEKQVGGFFREGSAKDLREVWQALNLPEPTITTPKGEWSFSKPSLLPLKGNKFIADLIEVKHLSSVISSTKDVDKHLRNGRLHPQFLALGEGGSARLYTSEPATNQMPVELRRAVVPEAGKKFWYIDWSGAEIYHLAKVALQLDLIEIYESGKDLHAYIASKVLGKPVDQLIGSDRDVSKVVTFSIVYGSEGDAAARASNVPREVGVEWVSIFFKRFPRIKNFMDHKIAEAKRAGFVETWIGRRRYLPNIISEEAFLVAKGERQACNTPIQNGVADLMKWAMVRIDKKLPEFRLVFCVFDSFLIEVPEETLVEDYLQTMTEIFTFRHKGEVQRFNFKVKEGHSWGELQEQD